MAVPYSPGLMGYHQSAREILLDDVQPNFHSRIIIYIKLTIEELVDAANEMMRTLYDRGYKYVAADLARGFKVDLNFFGNRFKTGEGLWPTSREVPGDLLTPEEMFKGYDKWPEDPDIWKSLEGNDLLDGYDKWPEKPNIPKSMRFENHHDGYDQWPEEPDIVLPVTAEDIHGNFLPSDGDPDIWTGPSPDHSLRTISDYSRASHCPECDGTGSCSCSYVS